MTSFKAIWAMAAKRNGGDAALEAHLAEHRAKTPAQIAATPDEDRSRPPLSDRASPRRRRGPTEPRPPRQP